MEVLALWFYVLSSAVCIFFLRREVRRRKFIERELLKIQGFGASDTIRRGKFSELGLMSAGITHEISTPLMVISNLVTRVERTFRDADQQKSVAENLHRILAAVKKIDTTVSGVRRFIYRNDDAIEDEILLSELIAEVLLFCGERLKNHGIEFRTRDTESVFIKGHKGQLEQAILNLINNSFDAVDRLPVKWIEIAAVVGPSVIDVYFKDSGVGIPVDIRQHMMEPFFTSKTTGSSGLGLPAVKSIAERHGGSFSYIEKAPHTTFLLELPRTS